MSSIEVKRKQLADRLEFVQERKDVNPTEAIDQLKTIVFASDEKDEEIIKVKEQAIYEYGDLLAKNGHAHELSTLLKELRPFFSVIPKAKTAKIVRTIIDYVGRIPGTVNLQIELCTDSIQWATEEKRTFLRQRIQTRLAELYFEKKDYTAALNLLNLLLREVRRLDDKALLVEIQLLESRVQLALRNLPKSKAALTAARTAANGIYCPPLLQAEIDLQSGILHAEERDYKTAYSYFFEAFEAYNPLEDPTAVMCLKYMLLTRIMTKTPEDVQTILSGKNALKYSGSEVDAMRAVATAYQNRSLDTFEVALQKYKKELVEDPLIHSHLSQLYDNLLEQHLIRIIEPFSRVEIAHVAFLVNLPVEKVEPKLSQMILDKKLNGILDQGAGCLIVFEEQKTDKVYPAALDTIESMSKVVDSLFERAGMLSR